MTVMGVVAWLSGGLVWCFNRFNFPYFLLEFLCYFLFIFVFYLFYSFILFILPYFISFH